MNTSRVATWSQRLAIAAAALFVGSPLAIQLGLLNSLVGFPIFMVGALLGVVSLVLGIVGIVRTRAATGRLGRGRALAGTAIGLVILVVVVSAADRSVPPINDITTSPGDPPVFVAALELEPNRGRDMAYPGEEFAAQQRDAYPDLAPMEVASPPGVAFDEVATAMEGLGWAVTRRDRDAGALEATDTSAIFQFVDDVVVRIRPTATGSVVDVRSKSREGRGDLGANAKRIRSLRDALGG